MSNKKYNFTSEEIKGSINEDGIITYKPLTFRPREPFTPDKGDPPIKPNQTWSIYGRRGTGKSIFVEWMLYHLRDLYPWGWVFTKTKNNLFYEQHIPNSKILGPFEGSNLQAIIDRQKIMEAIYLRDNSVNPSAFIIWDDALGHELKYNDLLDTYYFNSRHWHTINLMTAQHVTGTPPPIRQNTDYAVIFKNDNLSAIQRLAEDFSGGMNYRDFQNNYMDKYTEDRNFLVVNDDPNVKKSEKYYTGKAEIIEEPFIMGGTSVDGRKGVTSQYWRDDYVQLKSILSGEIAKKRKMIDDLSDIEKVVKLFDISKPGLQIDNI